MGIIIDLSTQLGVNPVGIVIILIWVLTWKGFALWRAAKLNQPIWFVIFMVVTTAGILEALYIFIFSREGFNHLGSKRRR